LVKQQGKNVKTKKTENRSANGQGRKQVCAGPEKEGAATESEVVKTKKGEQKKKGRQSFNSQNRKPTTSKGEKIKLKKLRRGNVPGPWRASKESIKQNCSNRHTATNHEKKLIAR